MPQHARRYPSVLLPAGLSALLVASAGCGSNSGPVLPDPATTSRGAGILRELPGVTVVYGGNTGEIAAVASPGLGAAGPGLPRPLAESRGTDETARAGSLLEFFGRHASAFHLEDPAGELRLARDPVNDGRRTGPGAMARELGGASGLAIQHLQRTFRGVPVRGQFATGVFDGQGNLQGVITRLLAIDAATSVTPALDSAAALARVVAVHRARKVVTYTLGGQLQSVDAAEDGADPGPHAEELLLLPIERSTGRLAAVGASVDYRLAYAVRRQVGGIRTQSWVDATSGELLADRSDTPSGWWDQGTNVVAGANDESGTFQFFFTDTFAGTSYLAITGNNFVGSWLGPTNFVSIDNLYGATNRAKFTATPISIPSTLNGQANTWGADPTFNATTAAGMRLRQGSHFMASLTRAQDWYAARNWNGWDGRGGTFYGAIGVKQSAGASEDLNAWGGNGTLGIGGAPTSTGQYLGSSPMIVGHEVTHSVISATSKLEYSDESGATNEALADLFGKAITSAGDGFDSTVVGGDIGFAIRDMGDPTLYGQPDRYSKYVHTTEDSNGVHTNSGILNKAHGLLVRGGTFNGVTVGKIGMAETEKILRLANVYATFPATASMEEFANGVLTMCALTDALNRVFGDTHYAVICSRFRAAYVAVEVLPRPWATVHQRYVAQASFSALRAGVANYAQSTVELAGLNFSFLADAGVRTPAVATRLFGPAGLEVTSLAPGELGEVELALPEALIAAQVSRTSPLTVRLEAAGDTLPAGRDDLRELSTVVGSDYDGVRAVITQLQTGPMVSVAIENRSGGQFPAGLGAALFERSFAHAPLTLVAESQLPTAVADGGTVLLPLTGTIVPNLSLPIVNLLAGSEIPGSPGRYQAWFDSQGGLPETNDRSQYYVLVDPRDLTTELDKTNNLLCLNCRVPGQATNDPNGVVVRFPADVPTATLFPAAFQAAAARLPTGSRRPQVAQELVTPRLEVRTVIAPQ